MIRVQNLRTIRTYPFDDYLKLPGLSYSGIKNIGKKPFKETEKMRLGTQVHNYLLEPHKYDHANSSIVKPIAAAIKPYISPFLTYLEPELTVTCNFIHNGFILPYKGRIDLAIPNFLVIDLKVTEDILHGIEYFNYPNQLTGYATAINAKMAIIIAIHPKTKKVNVIRVGFNTGWWADRVIEYGTKIS